MIERAGETAKLGFKAHPHMLRHATGYALANAGHDTRALQSYLGHRNIQHTVKYTELAPTRFRDFLPVTAMQFVALIDKRHGRQRRGPALKAVTV